MGDPGLGVCFYCAKVKYKLIAPFTERESVRVEGS